jgi:Flp pilus assembly protein TadG
MMQPMRRKASRRLNRVQKGAVVVEFAFVAPLLFMTVSEVVASD